MCLPVFVLVKLLDKLGVEGFFLVGITSLGVSILRRFLKVFKFLPSDDHFSWCDGLLPNRMLIYGAHKGIQWVNIFLF